jgi:Xaa-Pro aminopeptidase
MHVPRYSLAERDRRWALARELMAAERVEALIACGNHGRAGEVTFAPDAYFSNDRPGSVVIFCRDADPVQLAGPDQPGPAKSGLNGDHSWISPARVGPGRSGPGPDAAGISRVLREHHLERTVVAVLGTGIAAPLRLNSAPWRDVLAELPELTLRPAGQRFMLAASCLSAEEMAVLRYCAAAGEAMARAMLDSCAPGVTEAQVYAAGTNAALRHGCQAAPAAMWSRPGFADGGAARWWYPPEPPRVLRPGDVLLAEPRCRLGLLETRHQLAIAIGGPHPDIETAAVIARACYEAGLDAARAGNTVGDLAEAMLAPLRESGARGIHPAAHALTPLGPVRALARAGRPGQIPRDRYRSWLPGFPADQPLIAGMPWALRPSAVVDGRAVTLSGTVVVGESGAAEFSSFTAQLLRAG